MRKGIFVAGTDTGVGKTYVARLTIEILREAGLGVAPFKPVETGCRKIEGRLVPDDALMLAGAARAKQAGSRLFGLGVETSGGEVVGEMASIVPYAFERPAAPYVAAREQGVEISISRIRKAYEALAAEHDFVVAEGAGGLLVPITDRRTIADLIEALELPLLLVAAWRLGVINHTLLTLEACRARGIEVVGVVLNETSYERHESAAADPSVIRSFGRVTVVEVPCGAAAKDAGELRDLLASLVRDRRE